MGCKSSHARTRVCRPPRREPRARARARALVLGLGLGLGSWQLVFGCSLGLVVGLVLRLGLMLVGLVLFRPPPFPRQRAKRDDTSSV